MHTFEKLDFVGWDCEGINDGFIDPWTERQKLVLIGNSTGAFLYNDKGIPQRERLNWILNQKFPANVRHVFFGGSYDFNKILEGLPPHTVTKLHNNKHWTHYGEFAFRYRPRKELALARLRGEFDFAKTLKSQSTGYIRFWDVIGFFQSTFLNVMREWLSTDYPDFELIQSGKLARLSFAGDDREFIIQYNLAECRALVEIMKKLHTQLNRTELRVRRWDGAGSVAGELFRAKNLRQAFYQGKEKIELPAPVELATRYAYFGGRIESGFMGHYESEVYNYDINSAYPFAASQLPNLNHGHWEHLGEIKSESALAGIDPLSVFRVQWYFHTKRIYYPFPFRNVDNSVIFPRTGERWIYYPELIAAIRSLRAKDQLRIWEGWEFRRAHGPAPFSVLSELYKRRQEMVKVKDPAQMVLKLGLNSVYGKLCQKLGWNEEKNTSPVFHNLLFAGWITSYIRGMIYGVVSQAQNDVISINTDGIVSKSFLPIRHSSEKELGGWTLDTHDELIQLQSGVYWLRKGKHWKERARGLGRVTGDGETETARLISRNDKIVNRIQTILNAWEDETRQIYFPVKLFVTSKKALTGPDWFPRWGHWYVMHDEASGKIGRALELRCTGWGKRRLHESPGRGRMVPTVAADNVEWGGKFGIDDLKRRDLGASYELPWINGVTSEENDNETDLVSI